MNRRVVVVVEAITTDRWAGVPGDVRVRRFLKNALRSFGLRVVRVEPEGEGGGGPESRPQPRPDGVAVPERTASPGPET